MRKLLFILLLFSSPIFAIDSRCPHHTGPFSKSALSPDGSILVCLVDAAVPNKYELYGVDGVRPPWRLSVNMADDRDVILFQVSTDRVAFTSDPLSWTRYELYSVPLSGSLPPTKLSKMILPQESDFDVDDFLFSGNGSRVIYRKGRNATGQWELRSAPSNEFGGPVDMRISQSNMSAVQRGFIVSGNVVKFAQDPSGSGVPTWYSVTVLGGAEIFNDGFESGGVTRWN